MHNSLVSVIIVNWNGKDILDHCIASVYDQAYKNIEVIIVDNNSTDESITGVKKKYKGLHIIYNKENKGFAEGNNIGLAYAKGKYILLLNNDALLTKACLPTLISKMEKNKNIGVLQPKIIYKGSPFYKDGSINSIGSFLTITGFPYHIGYGKNPMKKLYNKEMEIYTAFGACMVIRHSIIQEVGLFDADFFAYFEESDFCHRVWLYGSRVVYTPTAVVYHRGGVSARIYGQEKVIFHAFKNRICSFLKNFELLTLIQILPLHLFMCEVYAVVNLIRLQLPLFWSVQRSIFWNIAHILQTYDKRSYIQTKIRRNSDNAIAKILFHNPRLSYYLYFSKGLEYYKD